MFLGRQDFGCESSGYRLRFEALVYWCGLMKAFKNVRKTCDFDVFSSYFGRFLCPDRGMAQEGSMAALGNSLRHRRLSSGNLRAQLCSLPMSEFEYAFNTR